MDHKNIEILLNAGAMKTAASSKEFARQRLAMGLAGREGEKLLARRLNPIAQSIGAERLTDLLLWKDQEKSIGAQIDSVMVTPQGLVCIEMKNYIGCVKGYKQDRQWLYTDPNGDKKKFFNPILQNFGHLAAVRNAVKQKFHKIPVWGLIVFGDKCELHIRPGNCPVLNLRDVSAYFENLAKQPAILSPGEIKAIADYLDKQNDVSKEGRRAHLELAIKHKDQHIQKRRPKEEQDLGAVVVPTKFEGDFIIRNGKGEYQAIKDIYSSSLRAEDGQAVRKGHPAKTFVCPYTGATFPAIDAGILYDGLVAAYLRGDPKFAQELVDIKAEGRIITGNQRFDSSLNRYAADPNKFAERVFYSPWYQHVASTRSRHMDDLVNDAKQRSKEAQIQALDKSVSRTMGRQSDAVLSL